MNGLPTRTDLEVPDRERTHRGYPVDEELLAMVCPACGAGRIYRIEHCPVDHPECPRSDMLVAWWWKQRERKGLSDFLGAGI